MGLAYDQIKKAAGDDEGAHALEDIWSRKLVDWVADGQGTTPHAKQLANDLIRARDLDFSRWYA